MLRVFRTVVAVNLMTAILAVVVYYFYASKNGLPINHIFLGGAPLRREHLSPVEAVAIFETIVFFGFLMGRLMKSDMRLHRKFCGIFGMVWLLTWLISFVAITRAGANASSLASSLDTTLALYVWPSHILYALIGPNVDDDNQ
jgi:hypothetical protein